MRSVEIHALDRAVLEHAAMSLIIRQFVHVKIDILEIRLRTAIQYHHLHENRLGTIHAIRLPVVQMHSVPMECALACRNIRVIPIADAVLNVYSIRNVLVIELVFVTNVSILARERAVRMLCAKS